MTTAGLIEKLTPPTGAYGLIPVSSFKRFSAARDLVRRLSAGPEKEGKCAAVT